MPSMDERTDVVRVVVGLAVVVAATIALIVGFGVAVAKVAPDIGGDDIVEPDDDVRSYPDATALMAAIGCEDAQGISAFEGLGSAVRSYAQPTASQCATGGAIGIVYVDADDRLTAEDDDDVEDRLCATVAVPDTVATPTIAPDPAAPVETTVPPTTTTVPDTIFGLVRGPNWILATAAGEDAASSLQSRLGGVLFTKTCEAATD
jgi:hypothetical protein